MPKLVCFNKILENLYGSPGRRGWGRKRCIHMFEEIISIENLLEAWREFIRGKRHMSHNDTRTCCVLKCDIRKFFASIHHSILQKTAMKYIADPHTCSRPILPHRTSTV